MNKNIFRNIIPVVVVCLALVLIVGYEYNQSEVNTANASTEADITYTPDNKPALIAHAGGAVYGYRLTNSLEALDNAYSNGFRFIELDFEMTSDDKIVLLHDWENMYKRLFVTDECEILDLDSFKSKEKFINLTLMDIDDLTKWLGEHKDVYIITDVKYDNITVMANVKANYPDFEKRIIPQAYSYDEYYVLREMGFDNIILTLYRMNPDLDELVEFARLNKPYAITMGEYYLNSDLIGRLNDAGTVVYTHTINDLSLTEKYMEMGVYGVYTDYFIPNKFPYNK